MVGLYEEDVARSGSVLMDRYTRKAFAPKGIIAKHPRLVLFFLILGIFSVVKVVYGFVTFAIHRAIDDDNHHRNMNRKYLNEHGHVKPIFVVAGGAPRTGSTLIFNILRMLMMLRDPNTVASSNWMFAKLVPENHTQEHFDRIELLKSMSTSILVKVHTRKQWYEFVGDQHTNKFNQDVDLLVSGFRDLREETASALRMFEKNHTKWFEDQTWSNMCQMLIRRRNSLIEEAQPNTKVVDIKYEDWKNSNVGLYTLIKQLSAHIQWHYTEQQLKQVYQQVQRLHVSSQHQHDKLNHVEWHLTNLMSPRHISDGQEMDDQLIQNGIKQVEQQPICNQWLRQKNYIN